MKALGRGGLRLEKLTLLSALPMGGVVARLAVAEAEAAAEAGSRRSGSISSPFFADNDMHPIRILEMFMRWTFSNTSAG